MTDTNQVGQVGQAGLVSLEDMDPQLAGPAASLRGLTVVNSRHHRVGVVQGVIVEDEEPRAQLLVVTSGGLLGMPVRRRLVSVETVTRVDEFVHIQGAS